MRYAIVIEKADANYSAYVPDLPGCVATGDSVEAVEHKISHRRTEGRRIAGASAHQHCRVCGDLTLTT